MVVTLRSPLDFSTWETLPSVGLDPHASMCVKGWACGLRMWPQVYVGRDRPRPGPEVRVGARSEVFAGVRRPGWQRHCPAVRVPARPVAFLEAS